MPSVGKEQVVWQPALLLASCWSKRHYPQQTKLISLLMDWIANFEFKVANIYPGYAGEGVRNTIECELEQGWILVGFSPEKNGDGGIFARPKKNHLPN